MMVKLLEKTSGWTDCEQVKQLQTLYNVMNMTKEVKIGRGRNATFKKEFIYQSDTDQEIRDNINYSLKYYKNLCSNSEITKKE